jgi:hypothetical protein
MEGQVSSVPGAKHGSASLDDSARNGLWLAILFALGPLVCLAIPMNHHPGNVVFQN